MHIAAIRETLATLILTAALSAAAGTAAHAQSSRLYFAGYMGLNAFKNLDFTATGGNGTLEPKDSMSFAGALGLRITPRVRLEAEISYTKADHNNMTLDSGVSGKPGGHIKTWLYMINGYYDFDLDWKNLTPFLTAGFGLASQEGKISGAPGGLGDVSENVYGLAWSLGGGLKYRVKPDLAFTGGYRYVGTTDLELNDYNIDYSSHEFRLGLEYDLPVDWIK